MRRERIALCRSTSSLERHGTEVALVPPAVGLVGKQAGQPFTLQVYPLVGRTVEADGEVFEAGSIHVLDGSLASSCAVGT